MTRRGIATGILGIWLVAVALLVRREYVSGATDPLAEAAFTLPPSATYFTVELGGQQIGYASSTIDTLLDTLRVLDLLVLELPVDGTIRRTDLRSEATMSRALRLRTFQTDLRDVGTRFVIEGTVGGYHPVTGHHDGPRISRHGLTHGSGPAGTAHAS